MHRTGRRSTVEGRFKSYVTAIHRKRLKFKMFRLPSVGPGEVRIAVSAASLNFGDIARCRGTVASVMGQIPFTLGMDVCGVVDAAGEGATEWVGRRVVAMTKQSLGGLAEYAIAPVTGTFDAPPELR